MPEMSSGELAWKAHFALGAMAHTLTVRPQMDAPAAGESPQIIVRRLVSFVSSGFRAPSNVEKEIEVNR